MIALKAAALKIALKIAEKAARWFHSGPMHRKAEKYREELKQLEERR